MATFPVSTDTNYSDLVGIVDGDTIDISGSATLTINETTVEIGSLFFNNPSRTVEVINNTATPIFFKTDGSSISQSGTFRFEGDMIILGVSDGTPSQQFTLPQDLNSESYDDIGFVTVEGRAWSQVDTLTNTFSDERGELFEHDTTGNTITFGDGTNGKIPANGETIRIPNIQWKANGSRLNAFGGVFAAENLAMHTPDISNSGLLLNFTGTVGSYNNEQAFTIFDRTPNVINELVVNGDASHNTRLTLGQVTANRILLVSQSNSSTEAVGDQAESYNITTFDALFLVPRNNANARVRLSMNNSVITTLNAMVGDGDFAFRPYDGNGGVVENLNYSCISKRDQTVGAYGIVLGRGLSTDFSINRIRKIGSETSTEMTRAFDIRTVRGLKMQDFVSPSDFICTRFFDVESAASVEVKNFTVNGTITDNSSRDMDTSSQLTTTFRNVSFPDETSVGSQASDGAIWDNIMLVANTPVVGRRTRSVTTRDVTNGTTGYIGLQPYYQANDQFVSLISGDANQISETRGRYYVLDSATEVEVESRNIGGVTAINSLSIGGFPNDFTFEFDMKTADGTYTGTYQDLNVTNLQSAFAALTGYDSDVGLFIKYRTIRSGGTPSSYIQTISIGCNFDPTYVAAELLDVNVTAPNLLENTRVELYNITQDLEIDNSIAGATGYSTTVTIGSTAAAAADIGDTIRLRATFADGVSYKEPLEVLGVMTATGLSFVNNQTDWTVVNSLAINGSTVTEFTADYPNVEVDINDTDNQTTKQRLIAWYANELTTEEGISNFYGAFNIQDAANYEIVTSVVDLKLDNKKTAPLLFTDQARLFRDDGTTVIESTSNSIQLDAGKVFETNVSGLTAEESTALLQTKRNAANAFAAAVANIN